MKCPKCKSEQISTIDTRSLEKGNSIRRRKKCDKCNFRWSTYELSKSMMDYYENQMKRLFALEQFQKNSCSFKNNDGSGKTKGIKWTKSETDRLITMYFEQFSYREIAEILNRSYSSVEQKILKLRKQDKLNISLV